MLSFFSRGALSLAVVSLLSASAAAEVFSKLASVPEGWKLSNAPAGKEPVRLQIALLQSDPARFEQAVLDMSTPDHPNYGKYFRSHDEMKRMLLPRGSTVNAVREWLESAGISDIQQDADWITFHTDVETANDLLNADFRWYQSTVKRNLRRLRTLEYSVPDAIARHVNMIQPTTRFGQIRPSRSTHSTKPMQMDVASIKAAVAESSTASCGTTITPNCLHDLYNIGDYQALPNKSHVAFCSYLEEYARYKDFALFQENLAPKAKGQNFSVITYNGGLNDQNASGDSGEANLDAQYILGISAPARITEFSTGGRGKLIPDLDQPDPNNNNNEPYLEFLQNVVKLSDADLPKVISTSYGEDEQSIPKDYANTVCDLYKQLGGRGVSIIFSSGDSGVGSACATNDGKNTTHFPPQFPAACPWVTSVGATHNTSPEQAAFFSSGGFSDFWARPAYQNDAVSKYLKTIGNKFSGLYNAQGRAFPDVAAQGMNYAIYDKGHMTTVDGTSASAPVFAGIVALLNDARTRAGQSPMGFLNPFLYSKGVAGLNDITHGGSTGCDGNSRFGGKPNGSPVVPYASWNATQGWDPVTGLGTPDFGKLRTLAVGK